MPTELEQLGRPVAARHGGRDRGGSAAPRRSARRPCAPGSARSSAPGRSSRSRRRARARICGSGSASRSCTVPSARRSSTWPVIAARGGAGVRRMMARLVTLLPEPALAHQRQRLAGAHLERDAAHGRHRAAVGRKRDAEIARPSAGGCGAHQCRSSRGIERVAQPVADEVEAGHGQRDHQAGEDREPGGRDQVLLARCSACCPSSASAAGCRSRGS